jgi:tRNA(Ile)-lysidine synthase
VCENLGCGLDIQRVAVVSDGEGLEAAARKVRYGVFARALAEPGVLLQGHHGDDQLETMLLHLMRGSGPSGMAGIPSQRSLAAGEILRPFLSLSRADLLAYAEMVGLRWINDESNSDEAFDRNYLRQRVAPALLARFQHAYSGLSASSQAMAEAQELQVALAWQDADLSVPQLSLSQLKCLKSVRQKNVLRVWFEHQTGEVLPRARLQQIVLSVLAAKHDAAPVVAVGDWSIERSRDWLAIVEASNQPSDWSADWDFTRPLVTPYGTLSAERVTGGCCFPSEVNVRFRRGGERLRPLGRGVSKSLKALFKEADMPLWQRRATPLICDGEEVLCAVDLCVDEQCEPRGQTMGWRLHWQR